jgi:hypothetical protein
MTAEWNEETQKQLTDRLDKLEKENATILGQIEANANARKTELEALKKELQTVSEAAGKVQSEEDRKKLVDRIQKIEESIDTGSPSTPEPTKVKTDEERVREIEASLTAEQIAAANEGFKRLPATKRIAAKTDAKLKLQIYDAVLEQNPAVPDNLIDPAGESGDEVDGDIRRAFNLAERDRNFVPGEGRGVPQGFRDAGDLTPGPKVSEYPRLASGKIPHPKKETAGANK